MSVPPRPYRPRLPPREHQVEAARRRAARPSRPTDADVFAYLMEMGTGKSKVVVDEFGERAEARDLQDLLLFAPAGCYANWYLDHSDEELCELHKHLDPVTWDKLVINPWRSGGGAALRERLRAMVGAGPSGRPRALIVNTEAMSSVDRAIRLCEEFCASSRRGVMVVVDESTAIRGRDSRRTAAITAVGRLPTVRARRMLTGLATPKSPLDLYSQYAFLDERILGFRSFFGFRGRHAVRQELKIGGRSSPRNPRIVVAYKNVQELREKIEPYSYRVLKRNCLDLPEKEYAYRDVELHPEQRRIYDEMREFCVAELSREDFVTASMVLTQRMRLDQILCGHVKDAEGAVRPVPELRVAALLELLEDYEGKAIIWTSHDYCVREISRRLEEAYWPGAVARYWGGNRATREQDERRFKGDARCRFMVSTPASGGRGNTWTMAGLSIFYNNSDDLEHRMQAEDRTHRDGLREGANRALYVDLVARGTIDQRKIQNLRKKIDLATVVMGDDYREWLI